MKSSRSRRASLAALLAVAASCADAGSSCGCAERPDLAVAAAHRIPGGAQLYLPPSAFDFLETHLPALLERSLPGGLNFDLEARTVQEGCLFGACAIDAELCGRTPGCPIAAAIDGFEVSSEAPDRVRIRAQVDASGVIDLVGRPTCDVQIAVQDRPLTIDAVLRLDPLTDAMFLDFADADLQLETGDLVPLSGPDCGTLDALLPLALGLLNQQLSDELEAQLAAAEDELRCMPCDHYATGGCVSGSACAGDPPFCRPAGDAASACVARHLGFEGLVSTAEAVPGGRGEALRMLLGAGQPEPYAQRPAVAQPGGGVRIELLAGAEAAAVPGCVPACEPPGCTPPSLEPPGAIDFEGEVAFLGLDAWLLGLGLSDRFLDRAAFEAWQAGALCLAIDASTSSALSTGTFSALLGSLGSLDEGRSAPMRIGLRPQQAPAFRVGLGTFATDAATGERRIDEALLTLELRDLALDFSAFVQDRWIRLFTLLVDLELPIGLDAGGGGALVPVIGDLGPSVRNVRAQASELLEEDPAVLEELLPTLLDLAAPALAGGLPPVELPEVLGFTPVVKAVAGIVARPGARSTYEHVGVFVDLQAAQPLPVRAADTEVRLVEIRREPSARPSLPPVTAVLDVVAPGIADAEVQLRLGDGPWSTWRKAGRIAWQRPALAVPGRHRLQVRARAAGQPASLDETPASLPLLVDFEAPRLRLLRAGDGAVRGVTLEDDVSPPEALRVRLWRGGASTELVGPPSAQALAGAEAIEVWDEAGNLASASLAPERPAAPAAEVAEVAGEAPNRPAAAQAEDDPPATGCSASGEGGAASGGWLLVGLAAGLRRRRPRA